MNPFRHSRQLAANIRGARLVALDSDKHIVLEDEPAWPVFLRELTELLSHDRPPVAAGAVAADVAARLSARAHGGGGPAAVLGLSGLRVSRHHGVRVRRSAARRRRCAGGRRSP